MVFAVLMVILATLVPTINCQVMYQHKLAAKPDLLKVRHALVSEETRMTDSIALGERLRRVE